MTDRDCCFVQKERMDLTFMLWDCIAKNITMGCCAVDDDTVFVILNYTDTYGATKVFKGEAWSSDAVYPARDRRKARMECVEGFFEQMRGSETLRAFIVFDGQLRAEGEFDLHLHFDHPLQKRSLLVKNISKGDNPLTVIDAFS